MNRSTSAGLLTSLALAAGVGSPGAAQTLIEVDAPVSGDAALHAPVAGISFTVPPGFQGAWDPEVEGLVLESSDGMILGLWGWSEGEVEEAAGAIEARLSGLGLRLEERGEPTVGDAELMALFAAASAEGPGFLAAAIRRGDDGNVFAVAVLGGPDEEDAVQAVRDTVIGSLRLTRPGAATWRAEVEGAVLSWSSSGSDMSSGTTTATGASSSTASIALCPGGVYRYSEESESYVSIEGVSASNASSDGHAGQWWITANLAGQARLTLEASDGRVFYWSVEEADGAYLIDGYRYVVSGSC